MAGHGILDAILALSRAHARSSPSQAGLLPTGSLQYRSRVASLNNQPILDDIGGRRLGWRHDMWFHVHGSAVPSASSSRATSACSGATSPTTCTHSERQIDCKQRQNYSKTDATHDFASSAEVLTLDASKAEIGSANCGQDNDGA